MPPCTDAGREMRGRDRLHVVVHDAVVGLEQRARLGVDERVPGVVAVRLLEVELPGEPHAVADAAHVSFASTGSEATPPRLSVGGLRGAALPLEHRESARRQPERLRGGPGSVVGRLPRALAGGRGGDVRDGPVAGAEHAAVREHVHVDDPVEDLDPLVQLLEVHVCDPRVAAEDDVRDGQLLDVGAGQAELLLVARDVLACRLDGRVARAGRDRRAGDEHREQRQGGRAPEQLPTSHSSLLSPLGAVGRRRCRW